MKFKLIIGVLFAFASVASAVTDQSDNIIVNQTLTNMGTTALQGNTRVGTTNLFVDVTNKRVGVNTATPAFPLDVVGNGNVFGTLSVTGTTAQVNAPLGAIQVSGSNGLHQVALVGGLDITRTIISVNYTNQLKDTYIAVRPTVLSMTNFLPSATAIGVGGTYIIKDEGLKASITNIFILPLGGSGNLIDGAASRVINTDAGSINVTTDGVNSWFVW